MDAIQTLVSLDPQQAAAVEKEFTQYRAAERLFGFRVVGEVPYLAGAQVPEIYALGVRRKPERFVIGMQQDIEQCTFGNRCRIIRIRAENGHFIAIETVYAIFGRQPDVSFGILRNRGHGILRQPVFPGVMRETQAVGRLTGSSEKGSACEEQAGGQAEGQANGAAWSSRSLVDHVEFPTPAIAHCNMSQRLPLPRLPV